MTTPSHAAPAPAEAEAERTTTTTADEPRHRFRYPLMLRALRHRNYRLFFFGQLVSLIGTWMQQVAQGWLVLRLTDSPFQLGLVSAAASLPVLLLSLSAGAVADRVPKRTLLLWTQIVSMALALILALLTLLNVVQVWHVLVLAALLGVATAFDAPARQAFAVELVGKEDLLNAIALNSSIFNAARTIGPAVAGIVVAAIGEGPAFLFNGLTFIAVIIGLMMIRITPTAQGQGRKRPGGVAEGLRYIANQPQVRTLLILVGSMSFFSFVYITFLPVFARDILQVGASGLGWMAAVNGTGALIGSLGLARFGDKMRRGPVVLFAATLFSTLLVLFTLVRSFPIALLLLLLMGWSGVTAMALTNTLIQSIVPDELRGRVMSVFSLLLMGLSPLSALLVGSISEGVGTPLAVAGAACISIAIALGTATLSPHVRRINATAG